MDGTASSLRRPLTPTQLVSVFKLADRFSPDSIIVEMGKTIISRPLRDASSAQYLHLAVRFKEIFGPEHRRRWYLHLVSKKDPLTEEEGEMLGGKVAARLGRHREAAFVTYLHRSGTSWGANLERPAVMDLGDGWADNIIEDII